MAESKLHALPGGLFTSVAETDSPLATFGQRLVFIRVLVLPCNIGIHRHEKDAPQRVRINLDLSVREGDASIDDAIDNVVCYEEIATGVRAIVGKGGMGAKTLGALKEVGAVYLNAIGGAAQFYARTITSVDGVSLLEFGTPEAMWHLTVEDFPAIVTMDAHGNSLHKDIEQESGQHLEAMGV